MVEWIVWQWSVGGRGGIESWGSAGGEDIRLSLGSRLGTGGGIILRGGKEDCGAEWGGGTEGLVTYWGISIKETEAL